MLESFIIGYCIYFVINIYTSFMQIAYVQKAKKLKPVILNDDKYEIAGNYSIEKEKLTLASSFYEFVIFFAWISVGLEYLDSQITVDSLWLKAVIFVDVFIIINWVL